MRRFASPTAAVRTRLALLIGLWMSSLPAQTPLQPIAGAVGVGLSHSYLGFGIESRCGRAGFMVEFGHWKCVRRDGDGRLEVIDFGRLDLPGLSRLLIRGPLPDDRRLLFAQTDGPFGGGNPVHAVDPVTLTVSEVGRLPQFTLPSEPAFLVDYNGDGRDEYLVHGDGVGATQLVTLSGSGALLTPVQTLAFTPVLAGQFDADAPEELGSVDASGRLVLTDASTLQTEPFQPEGVYSPSPLSVVMDWDADGIDELAVHDQQYRIGLIDPNRTGPTAWLLSPWTALSVPFSPLRWLGQATRELVIHSSEGLAVVDPNSATVIGQWNTTGIGFPDLPMSGDWDQDGDDDLSFVASDGLRRLYLLRNAGDVNAVQTRDADRRVIGRTQWQDMPALVSIEILGSTATGEHRLRLRDADDLALLADAPLPRGQPYGDQRAVADFHPREGDELLIRREDRLQLFGLDGTLLWTLLADTQQLGLAWASVAFPDPDCSGTGCQRVLVQEYSNATHLSRVVLVDTAVGEPIRAIVPDGDGFTRVTGLSDLNGDTQPDMLYVDYAASAPPPGIRLTALDGASGDLVWRTDVNSAPVISRRTDDAAARLLILDGRCKLSYLSPVDGSVRRSRELVPASSGFCEGADVRYLRQTETQGQWIVSNVSAIPLATIGRDLRGPLWTTDDYIIGGLATGAPNRVYVGDTQVQAIRALSAPEDGLFTDEFEGW